MIKPRLYEMTTAGIALAGVCYWKENHAFLNEEIVLNSTSTKALAHSPCGLRFNKRMAGDWYIAVGTSIFLLNYRTTYYLKSKFSTWD